MWHSGGKDVGFSYSSTFALALLYLVLKYSQSEFRRERSSAQPGMGTTKHGHPLGGPEETCINRVYDISGASLLQWTPPTPRYHQKSFSYIPVVGSI